MKDQVKPFMSDICLSCFILLPKIKVDDVEKHPSKSLLFKFPIPQPQSRNHFIAIAHTVKGYHSHAPNSFRLLRNTEVICSRRFSKLAAMPIKIMPAIRPTTHLIKG